MANAQPAVAGPDSSKEAAISESEILDVYRTMVLARVMDERCLTLQRQGRIGFYAPLQGQEAAQVGCAWALEADDWLFPAYRELAVALVRKVPVSVLLNQYYGNAADGSKGRQMPNHFAFPNARYVSASSPVGTQITHAVGAAMAARIRGDRVVTVAFFGDGTTSSNDFHAGLNFAGVYRTPTLFFIQNNQWAISFPREKQTRSATLAEKAAAYGFPGVVVDGNDVHEVYRAVSEARRRAVDGEGPTLIEAQVYRLGPHSTSDDPKRYRSEEELQKWKEKDPLARLKHELLSDARLSESEDQQIYENARSEVARAVTEAEATAPPDPLSIFDDVYAERPPALDGQRARFEELLRDGVIRP